MEHSKLNTPVATGLNPTQQQVENPQQQNAPQTPVASGIAGLAEIDQSDLIHIVKILQKYNFKVITRLINRLNKIFASFEMIFLL